MIKNSFMYFVKVLLFVFFIKYRKFLIKIPSSFLKAIEHHFQYTFPRVIIGQIYFDRSEEELAYFYFRKAYEGKVLFENPWDELALQSYLKILIERDPEEVFRILKCTLGGKSIISFFSRKLINQILERNPEYLVKRMESIEIGLSPKFFMAQVVPVQNVSNQYHVTNKSYPYSFKDPIVYQSEEISRLHEVAVPLQFVAEVGEAEILGAFQVLKGNQFVLYEPASNPSHGIVAGVWRNFCSIQSEAGLLMVLSDTLPKLYLEQGILLSGRATENYFHWLIEYLPKILNINDAQVPVDIPLIVKSNLPKQFYEVLQILTPERQVFTYDPSKTSLVVKNLWLTSVHTYHPDDFRLPYWQGGAISHRHLQFVRDTVFNSLAIQPEVTREKKKIYLSRQGGRAVENDVQIEAALIKRGFQIIYPENLTFSEQVKLFHNADLIVGATGAAFSNLIFVRPQVKVIVLVSERNATYCMKSNLANFAGARFVHIVGKHVYPRSRYNTEDEYVHSNFKIDVPTLLSAISQTEEEWRKPQ